jgi:hypothetical protein
VVWLLNTWLNSFTDGQPIPRWKDFSGLGNDFTQPDVPAQPAKGTDFFGNKFAYFHVLRSLILPGALPLGSSHTVFMVIGSANRPVIEGLGLFGEPATNHQLIVATSTEIRYLADNHGFIAPVIPVHNPAGIYSLFRRGFYVCLLWQNEVVAQGPLPVQYKANVGGVLCRDPPGPPPFPFLLLWSFAECKIWNGALSEDNYIEEGNSYFSRFSTPQQQPFFSLVQGFSQVSADARFYPQLGESPWTVSTLDVTVEFYSIGHYISKAGGFSLITTTRSVGSGIYYPPGYYPPDYYPPGYYG